jgi:hypothetical protein
MAEKQISLYIPYVWKVGEKREIHGKLLPCGNPRKYVIIRNQRICMNSRRNKGNPEKCVDIRKMC